MALTRCDVCRALVVALGAALLWLGVMLAMAWLVSRLAG